MTMKQDAPITLEVGGSPMALVFGLPDPARFGRGPHTTVLLAYHREGYSSFTEEVFNTFIGAGYAVAVPDLYHRSGAEHWEPGYQQRNDAQVLADLDAAWAWLVQQPEVAPGRIVVAGHCQGGRIALLAASVWPERFAACLSYYGGGMFEGWGSPSSAFDRLGGLRCPVAAFFGLQDQHPSPAEADRLEAALRAQGLSPEFHRYPDAGHAFMFRESPRFRPGPAQAAWQSSFDFLLRQGLAPRPAA